MATTSTMTLTFSNRQRFDRVAPTLLISAIAFGLFLGFKTVLPRVSASARLIPAGTIITVRAERSLNSSIERVGDTFDARVVSVQSSDGRSVSMGNARVQGRCVAVRKEDGPGRPGYLRLSLTSLHDSKGQVSPLMTSAISQWGSRDADSEAEDIAAAVGANGGQALSDKVRRQADEAEVTPEMQLSFVLLKSVAVPNPMQSR